MKEFIFELQRFAGVSRNNKLDNQTLEGTAENDSISNGGHYVSISAGDGNDMIDNGGGTGVTIDGGDGDDSITNSGDETSIDGGAGNDYVYNAGNDVTISGSAGDDEIQNDSGENYSGKNVLFVYNDGDGSDTVTGFDETSTLQIGDGTGTYSTQVSGDDIIVTAGNGSVLLTDVSALSTVNISGKEVESNIITLTEEDDKYSNSRSNVTILALGGDDSIDNRGSEVFIDLADGNDTIENRGSQVSIIGGDGDDSIINWSSQVSIIGGEGSETIQNVGDSVTIDGGGDDDSIFSGGKNVSISGGDGDDSIRNWASQVSIIGGEGSDYIYNEGNNVSISGGDGDDSIYNSRGSQVSIIGGDGDDSIVNWGSQVSIIGGGGDDSIYSAGKNVSISGGEGSDTIEVYTGYSWNSETRKYDTKLMPENVTVSAGDGDDYIYNNAPEKVTVTTGTGDDTIKVGASVTSFTVTDFGAGDVIELNASVESIGGSNTLTAGGVLINGVTASTEEFAWAINNGVATLTKTVTGGAKLSDDGKTITYTDGATENLFTFTGLRTGVTVEQLTKGIIIRGTTVFIVDISILPTGTFAIPDGYTIEFDESITAEPTEISSGWKFEDTTAIYTFPGTTEGYVIKDGMIVYQPATGGGTFMLTGLREGITIEQLTKGITINGTTVTINDPEILSTTNVSITDGYTLELGEGVTRPTEIPASWSVNGTTATYTFPSTTDGYVLEDGVIVYKEATGYYIFTLTGLREGITIDRLTNGIKVDGTTVTINDPEILSTTNVSITDEYTLKFGEGVTEPTKIGSGWKIDGNGTTATYTFSGTTEGYVIEDGMIVYQPATGGGTFMLTGLREGITIEQLTKGIKVDGTTVTITDVNILSTTNVSITDEYTLKLGEGVTEPTKISSGWKIDGNGTTATYTFPGTTEGYVLEKGVLVYKAATGGGTFKLTGLKRGITVEQLTKGITISGTTVTITDVNILSTTNVSITDEYTLKLGGTVTEPTKIGSGWKIDGNGTTATYTFAGTTDGYVLENGRIVYKAATGGEKFTLTGLKRGITVEQLTKGITINGTTVTITDVNLLTTTNVSITDEYTLKLGENIQQPKNVNSTWEIDNTTGKYYGAGTSDGYRLLNGIITYRQAVLGKLIFTLTGLKPGLTVEQLTKGITVNNQTITVTPAVVGTNFTIPTGSWRINFNPGDYSGSSFKVNGTGIYTIYLYGTKLAIDLSDGRGTYNFYAPDGGGNTFLVGPTSGKYNFYDFSRTDLIKLLFTGTVTPIVQGPNVLLRIGNVTLTFPNGTATGIPINIVDTQDEPLIDASVYKDRIIDGERVTLLSAFREKSFTLTDEYTYVEATAVSRSLTLTGNENDNTLIGGKGSDTLAGIGGENLLTGGKGSDMFIYGGGDDTVTDYGDGNDKISLGADLVDYEIDDDGNLTLNIDDGGSVTILDGFDTKINFVANGKTTAQIFTEEGIYNANKTAVTLKSATETFTAGSKLVTIHGDLTSGVSIVGSTKNNKIFGGDGDDTLNGGAGSNTLRGGDGKDVFVFGNGKATVTDYTLDDKISLSGALTSETVKSNGDVLLGNGKTSLTVKKFDDDGQTITFLSDDDETNKTYYREKIVAGSGVTLLSAYKEKIYTADSLHSAVDASLFKKNLTLTGGLEDNTLIGGRNSNFISGGGGTNLLTGGAGVDVFVHDGGIDTITDYELSDKISLGAAPTSFNFDGNDLILIFQTGSLTIKDGFGKRITLVEGGKPYVNVFSTEGIFDGGQTAVTLNATTDYFDAEEYPKLTTIDGTPVTDALEILGNKKSNKIYAGNGGTIINGGKGNDSLWGGEGSDTFVYRSGGGKDVIYNFGDEDALDFGGKDFSATVKDKSIAFKVGTTANAVTLKEFTATTFNIDGTAYGVEGTTFTKKTT